ncbi:MAG: queuine tRNA-ribosyltransferase [Tatlockia sp.]|nr:queuine tRNA-ribosyltransferase [Tatlockia sp.]
MKLSYAPVLTSQSGLCLTLENWQELGVSTAVYYLDNLLMKPGYSLLKSLSSLRSFCGWAGTIVLNASLAAANSEGIYGFRSLYDGSKLTISQDELYSLIVNLQPDLVILPPGMSNYLANQQLSLPNTITPLFSAYENADMENNGMYFSFDKAQSFTEFLKSLKQYPNNSLYVSGAFNLMQAYELIAHRAKWLESDKPASDALAGMVYGESNNFSLLESDMANQHEPIILNCDCPTCKQNLTRAYLHHLFHHTPLLCHRFLIQHNAHFYKTQIELMLPNIKPQEQY